MGSEDWVDVTDQVREVETETATITLDNYNRFFDPVRRARLAVITRRRDWRWLWLRKREVKTDLGSYELKPLPHELD